MPSELLTSFGRSRPWPGRLTNELSTLAALAVHVPAALLGSRQPVLEVATPAAPTTAETVPTPVLLVHGYLGTEACWTPLLRRLHESGFSNVFMFRYNSVAAGIPQLAAELVIAAAGAMGRVGRPGVHLVGHSLGGLVARYAVQRQGLDSAALGVVTVATPHRGSTLAMAVPGRAAAQMRPGSPLLTQLPALTDSRGVSWAVIYSDADVVVPAGRARAGLAASEVLLPGHGHVGILRSRRLARTVVRHLLDAEGRVARPSTSLNYIGAPRALERT